jgi:hypothetical protein
VISNTRLSVIARENSLWDVLSSRRKFSEVFKRKFSDIYHSDDGGSETPIGQFNAPWLCKKSLLNGLGFLTTEREQILIKQSYFDFMACNFIIVKH